MEAPSQARRSLIGLWAPTIIMRKNHSADNRPTILVVDDEQDIRELFVDFLSDEYNVLTAASGSEAVEIINPEVSVVLLDRRMGEVSGDEVLSEIRVRGLDCRVVMVTAVRPDVDILDLPFDDYLVKPVDSRKLHETISQMLVRGECDETIQNVIALVSKMATLESKMRVSELHESAEYAALEAQLGDIRAGVDLGETDDGYTEFTAEKIGTIFG